jgi:PAS domain-containing protein
MSELHTPWTTTLESPEGLQRKLTEQRMQGEQLRLLGSAIHVTPEGIAILTPAVEAVGPRIAFVNDGFCVMYARRREEIIGETPQIFGIIERHQSILESLLHHVFEHRPFEAEATARRGNSCRSRTRARSRIGSRFCATSRRRRIRSRRCGIRPCTTR